MGSTTHPRAVAHPESVERYFFIHVMKTGGGTLKPAFARLFPGQCFPDAQDRRGWDGTIGFFNQPELFRRYTADDLEKYRFFSGHFSYAATTLVPLPLQRFTILRDPVDRTISHMHHLLRAVDQNFSADGDGRPPSLERVQSLYDSERVRERRLLNYQTKMFSLTLDEDFSYGSRVRMDRSRLERAKENLSTLSVIGFTERYGSFIDDLRRVHGLDVRPGQSLHVTEERVELTQGMVDAIREDCALDMELYDYALGLAESRGQARPQRSPTGPPPTGPAADVSTTPAVEHRSAAAHDPSGQHVGDRPT